MTHHKESFSPEQQCVCISFAKLIGGGIFPSFFILSHTSLPCIFYVYKITVCASLFFCAKKEIKVREKKL
jgi:hypothetical protein